MTPGPFALSLRTGPRTLRHRRGRSRIGHGRKAAARSGGEDAQARATEPDHEGSSLHASWCRGGCPIVSLAGTRVTALGASERETAGELPGDELVPGGRRTTYAITIDAPPEQVWAWLVQIGRTRGGFYTYTGLERLLGADIENRDYLDPRLQTLNVGDRIWMTPSAISADFRVSSGRSAASNRGGHLSWAGGCPTLP